MFSRRIGLARGESIAEVEKTVTGEFCGVDESRTLNFMRAEDLKSGVLQGAKLSSTSSGFVGLFGLV